MRQELLQPCFVVYVALDDLQTLDHGVGQAAIEQLECVFDAFCGPGGLAIRRVFKL